MVVRLLEEALKKSNKSVLLLGPRQVGKSTLIRTLDPDLIINLASENSYMEHSFNPNLLEEQIKALKPHSIFIDEVQRVPKILNTVQAILDQPEFKKIKFYLTGSSARKLKRGQANLLPGRVIAYQLKPLCSAELDYKLEIRKAMSVGTLPEVYLLKDQDQAKKILQTYSNIYIKEEIRDEALTRNLDNFIKFINSAAFFSGFILDYSKIAKRAKISRQTCVNYFELLEDTLIADKCSPYEDVPEGIQVVKHPKFFLFDVGILNALLGSFDVSQDRIGRLFEHLVFNQIINSANSRDKNFQLHYFRTKNDIEVDFILKMEKEIFAIEIKSGSVSENDLEHLNFFSKYVNKNAKKIVVCMDKTPRKIKDTLICDLSYFLKEIGL